MAGGNLSPRQRMINMMYLVLTALLALNVSKEVLNSFFEVNMGIERTTSNFDSKNGSTYADINNAATNNPVKYQVVKEKADELKKAADALVDSLQQMKYNLVLSTDKEVYLGNDQEIKDEDGKLISEKAISLPWNQLTDQQQKTSIGYLNAKDNRDQSGTLFYNKKSKAHISGEGTPATKRKIEMQSIESLMIKFSEGNERLQKSIDETFNLEDRKQKDGKTIAWEHHNFYDMPAVGALTILSKLQSDIRNAEANVIDYLKKDIDAKAIKFAAAEGIQIPQSNFVLKGDSFRSQIFITANNPDQNPDIYVGEYDSIGDGQYEMRGEEGVDYEVVKVRGGKGMFARRTSSEGTKKWGGLIKMKTETGTKVYPFQGEYLVASKQAVASPTNMAVLYKNIENPLKVSVAGYSASQISASTRNGSIKVVNKGKGEWIVKPTKLENNLVPIIDLSVMEDGVRKRMGSVEFKVKDVPDPYPKAAGLSKWSVSRGALKGAQMLIAEMKNFPFDRNALSFAVKSYNIIAYNASGERLNIPTVKGGKFTKDVIDAIDNTPSGGTVTFTDIVAKRRGSKNEKDRRLGSIVYTIK